MNMELPELLEDSSSESRGPIQDTTLSRDVLARFQCNTLDEVKAAGGEGLTAIVIGSGMYGAFCAERIFRRGGKVLVLDSGPFVISEHIQNMADSDFDVVQTGNLVGLPAFGHYQSPAAPSHNRPTPIEYAAHSYHVGGKSVRWGGWSPRLTEEDLSQWPPAMAQYFRDYYREIEFQIGAFPTADFIKGPLNEALHSQISQLRDDPELRIIDVQPAPIAVQADQPASGLFSFDKYSSLPVLIETLRGDAKASQNRSQSNEDANSRRGLALVPRCRVLRLETEPTADGRWRVNALRVLHGHQRPVIDRIPVPLGCSVVLAANSLESTRLALDSFGHLPDESLGLMGRNFQVHLRTDLELRIPRGAFESELRRSAERIVRGEDAARSPFDPPDERAFEERVTALLGALQTGALHVQCSNGQRRFHIQVLAVTNPGGAAEALLYRQDTSLPELAEAISGQDSSFVAIKLILVGEIIGRRDRPVGDLSVSWAALSPNERDEIYGEGDQSVVAQHYSARRLYTYIPLSQEDEDFWSEMDETAQRLMTKLAGNAGGVQYKDKQNSWHSSPLPREELRQLHHSLGSTYHEAGTLWMSDERSKGVVDVQGRFHSVDNVFCCDQSVFVTSGSANPVPTGLVVAKRVSEAIAPDHVVSEPGFDDLFRFAEPKGDYVRLPAELGAMPVGWKYLGHGRFVRRGKMVESQGGTGLLYYDAEEFTDFILKLEWRSPLLRRHAEFFNNSGVYVRWPRKVAVGSQQTKDLEELSFSEFSEFAIRYGYEIQIDDTGSRPGPDISGMTAALCDPRHQTGAIYPAHFAGGSAPTTLPRFADGATGSPALALRSNPPGQWNEYVITVRGATLRVELNGHLVNEAVDHNNAFPKGLIALQAHQNGYRVQFRNVRIKRIAS